MADEYSNPFEQPGTMTMRIKGQFFDLEVGFDRDTGQYWGQARDSKTGDLVVPFTERFSDVSDAWAALIGELTLKGKTP